jgi:type VI secretion system secreted protein VgrG
MDGTSDLLRLLQREQSWSTTNRQLRLRLADGSLGEALDVLLPLRLVGSEAICGGIEYRIVCLASTPTLPLKALVALPIEIQILTDRGQLRSVCGIVTEARAGDFDGGLAVYHLVVRDALAIMEKRSNSRIFRYRNEIEIVKTLCDEWRQSNSVLGNALEIELDPLLDMGRYPAREQTMQYNESDAAFVRRLLKRRGIAWYFKPGRSGTPAADHTGTRRPAHTLVLFSDATSSLQRNAAGTVRYHREDATDGRDVITSWTAVRRLQPGKTTRYSWDYKNPGNSQLTTSSVRSIADQGSYGNELAASLDDYLVDIPHAGNDVEDHHQLGQLRMSRHEFESKCFQGEACVRDFCAGEYFTLEGHPEIDTHPPGEREFVITELELEASNNLPKDLAGRADRLLAGRRLAADGTDRAGLVQVRFTAVRRGVPIVPAFDPRVDLPHPQLQSAVVVGPKDEDVHCDALGRVKIRFPGMRAADHAHAHGAGASDGPADSAWVRVASSWAGNGPSAQQQAGALGLPRRGTEVLVAFLGGDPDRPIITGQVFNQASAPPAFSRVGNLPGNRYQSGTRTREIRGQRGNQLRFDDTHGQISAQLASDHGASELNLGWIAHPRAEGVAAPRGEGAELRSDEAVAIRGGRGVLITGESSRGAEGPQLGRTGLVGIAELVRSFTDELEKLAERHAGDNDTSRLADLVDRLKCWDQGSNVAPDGTAGGSAMLGMTAPDGIVAVSPDNVVIGSARRVDMASAGNAAVTAGGNVFLRAARTISAFAHSFGIKLIAGRGDVNVEAHDGAINIKAARRINLVSTDDIYIEARNVRIVSRGAQTDWGGDGTITQQSSGQHTIKSSSFARTGPGGGSPATPAFQGSDFRTDERVVLTRDQTDEPVRNRRYTAHLANGETIEGVTDDRGRTSLMVSQMSSIVTIEFDLD